MENLTGKNYIAGQWVNGKSGTIEVLNPANGEKLGEQACASSEDVDIAVKAAKRCHEHGEFRHMRPVERGRLVQKMGHYLIENLNEIAHVLSLDSGKPLWEASMEVESAARYFEYFGNQAETMEGRSIPMGNGYFDFTSLEPYGVSAQIIPWNFPIEMAARSISAGLATGNACVVKSPEIDPFSVNYIAKAAEHAGLPKGALNIICGHGKEAGSALSNHPDINQMVFTGSVPTGISIATAAAKNIVPCILELGGKSAGIVYPDADLDEMMSNVHWGTFFNAGQVCCAMSRLIVHEDIHNELVDKIASYADSLSVGPGTDFIEFGANMGAIVSQQQCGRIEYMCQQAQNEGATIITGGKQLQKGGFFMSPTIISNTSPDMKIIKDEVFGPVLAIQQFSTDEEAISLANGTDYGLVAGVFTSDIDKAMIAARDLRAGQIYINEWYAGSGVETPFGGYGKSGYGREQGRESLLNYVQTKNIGIALRKK